MTVTNNDLLKVDLRWTVTGIGVTANVFQCRVFQAAAHEIADDLAVDSCQDWVERIWAPMLPFIVVSFSNPTMTVYKKVGTDWNLIGTVLLSMDGGSIGDPLASGVAMLLEALTDTSKVLGKKYIGGLSELQLTAGIWTAEVLVAGGLATAAWFSQFEDLIDESTWYVPGVYSLKALAFKPFTGIANTRVVPAYQRRRKAGVGA